jgi:hypothetical protein
MREAMQVSAEDLALDRRLKYEPEQVHGIDRSPYPARTLPDAPTAPLLFDLASDPYEQNDLAAAHPDRVRAMQSSLATWFESVEADRRRTTGGVAGR